MRTKMSIENRAKQFMPFSALPGLEVALAAAEADAEASSSGIPGIPGISPLSPSVPPHTDGQSDSPGDKAPGPQ